MKIKLANTAWRFRLLSPEQFEKEHGEEHKNSGAVTDTAKHIIDFRSDEISDVIVRHELFHAYFDSLLLNDADLKMNQMEEVSASLIGKYGEELVKNSKKVIKWLKKELLK